VIYTSKLGDTYVKFGYFWSLQKNFFFTKNSQHLLDVVKWQKIVYKKPIAIGLLVEAKLWIMDIDREGKLLLTT